MTNRPAILEAPEIAVDSISKEDCGNIIKELCAYAKTLEQQLHAAPGISTAEERLRQQQMEASRRENVLVMRLTTKEQEVQEYLGKLEEIRMSAASASRTVLLDPAVNVMFQRMKGELQQAREQVDQTRQELNAWQFTPDSNTGKRLMARCRTLIQENEELGKLCSSGRVAKLEGDLALTKTACQELRESQTGFEDFVFELEEEMEGLQSTLVFLQNQLKKAREENQRLRRMCGLSLDAELDEEFSSKKDAPQLCQDVPRGFTTKSYSSPRLDDEHSRDSVLSYATV